MIEGTLGFVGLIVATAIIWWAYQKALESSYGRCGKCSRSWRQVQGHTTIYEEQERCKMGMFPLCESCWEFMTPEERLPYYQALVESWLKDARPGEFQRTLDKWQSIKAAVLAGK